MPCIPNIIQSNLLLGLFRCYNWEAVKFHDRLTTFVAKNGRQTLLLKHRCPLLLKRLSVNARKLPYTICEQCWPWSVCAFTAISICIRLIWLVVGHSLFCDRSRTIYWLYEKEKNLIRLRGYTYLFGRFMRIRAFSYDEHTYFHVTRIKTVVKYWIIVTYGVCDVILQGTRMLYYSMSVTSEIILQSKGWIALKWQILWETNKFQVSFCSPFKFVRRFFIEKKTNYSEQQRRWSACADAQADLRLCCSHIY